MRRLAVVTGAAGGIGSATVDAFRTAGWVVAGIDSAPRVTEMSLDHAVRLDLGDRDATDAIAAFIGGLPRVDALVNNAAVQVNRRLVDTDVEDWDTVHNVNLRAAYLAIKVAHDALRRYRGAVVNISSVHALATSQGVAAYAASKGGLAALTRAAALELAAEGIRVNAVLPGAVDTQMLREGLQRSAKDDDVEAAFLRLSSRTPLGRVGQPSEIAEAVLFLADAARSSFITGQVLVVDGGAIASLATETAP